MQRLKIALPDDLRARLDAASAKSGQSVAEEIRSRVEETFAREAADKPSADFLEGVALLPAEIERETGANWHGHAGAHEALVQAIISRLETLKPLGSTAFGDRPYATTSEDDPRKLGALIEFRLRRAPDFTNSPMRRMLVEEFQRSRGRLENGVQRFDTPLPARAEAERQQKQKADQQRRRGKKS
jgi:hypothetical protein